MAARLESGFAVLALVLTLAGCRSPEPRAPAEVTARAAAAVAARQAALPAEQTPHEATVFDELELSAAKRARTNALAAELGADLTDYDAAWQRVVDELVVSVRAGALDRSRVAPRVERAIAEYDRVRPRLARFAEALHAELDQQERRRLIALLGDDEAELSEEERLARREDRLERIIDLTSAQRTRLYVGLLPVVVANLSLSREIRDALAEAKRAFVEERFVAAELAFFGELPLHRAAEAVYDVFDVGLAVLEPAQEATLAAYLDAHLR